MEIAFILLILLFAKHFVFDFCWQPPAMLEGKGIYGNLWGVLHSLLHSWGTGIAIAICFLFTILPLWVFLLPLLDFGIHYNVDYVKAHFGPTNPAEPIYWFWLGMDQFMHYATYLFIAMLILL